MWVLMWSHLLPPCCPHSFLPPLQFQSQTMQGPAVPAVRCRAVQLRRYSVCTRSRWLLRGVAVLPCCAKAQGSADLSGIDLMTLFHTMAGGWPTTSPVFRVFSRV